MVGWQCTEGCSAGPDKICMEEKHLSGNRSGRHKMDERLAHNFDCIGIQPICYSLDKVAARPTHKPTRSDHMAVLTEQALLGKIRLSDSVCWFIPRLPLGRTRNQRWNTCKFFYWFIIQNKIWTADRISRHGGTPNNICTLCHTKPETALHMMAECAYSKAIWSTLSPWIGTVFQKPP
jgi:hypothetical protein